MHTGHKLQTCKFNSKISQQVCILVQSSGKPGASSAGSLLPSSPLPLSQKQATMPEETTQTAERLLLSDLAWSICSWAESAPVLMVGKELIPHSSPAETWISSQAAADEMSIPLHRASRVYPTPCQTTRVFSSLHSDGKKNLIVSLGQKRGLPLWSLCGSPAVAIDVWTSWATNTTATRALQQYWAQNHLHCSTWVKSVQACDNFLFLSILKSFYCAIAEQ